ENGKKEIDLLLIGEELPKEEIDSLKAKLAKYSISDSQLSISQGLNAKQEIDFSQIKASIVEDVFARQKSGGNSKATSQNIGISGAFPDIKNELKALYPAISAYTITKTTIRSIDTTRIDSITLFIGHFQKPLQKSERYKFKNWLKSRLVVKSDSLQVIIKVSKKIEKF